MAANAVFYDDLSIQQLKQDAKASDALNEILEEYEYYCKVTNLDIRYELKKMVSQTSSALRKVANCSYKPKAYVEPREIDFIKDCLNNFACSDVRVKEFKNSLIKDLTAFQNEIKTNYVAQISTYRKQQLNFEAQVQAMEAQKKQYVSARLAKALWPYDEKTKAYDLKITALKLQAQSAQNKSVELQQMRPAASEKDLVLYQMRLKEKYSDFC